MHNKELMLKIQSVLSDDLLTPKYRQLTRQSLTEGHCYASSEALFHLLGGKAAGYMPCVASFEENGEKFTHWWIKDANGIILDPTAEQFYSVGKEPPYHLGKNCGFLTSQPSKRAQTIMDRLLDLGVKPYSKNKSSNPLKA